MLFFYTFVGVCALLIEAAASAYPPYSPTVAADPLPVHNLSRIYGIGFENLAVRSNGQILATTTNPNASIWQLDPLSILPPMILYTIPNITSCNGIVEGQEDRFYVASGDVNVKNASQTTPSSYNIFELDVRNVSVLPGGKLTQRPMVQHIASIPQAGLLNGIALSRPRSNNLLVADTFRGLIWNVNVTSGEVGISLNSSSTKGGSSNPAGVNGLKVFNDTMYWTNTGTNTFWRIPINKYGNVSRKPPPSLIAGNLTVDDFLLDEEGTAYIAGPYDVITQVSPNGTATILTGTFASNSSSVEGPTALKFGRLESDRWSLYVTTDGGIYNHVYSGCGLSRIDLGANVTLSLS